VNRGKRKALTMYSQQVTLLLKKNQEDERTRLVKGVEVWRNGWGEGGGD